MKKHKEHTVPLLSHVPPSAVSREMKVPCPPSHSPPRTHQAGWARLSPFLLAFLSLSLAPLCFCFHIPRAIIRLSFCTPLRFLFHLSQTPSKFSKKFLFCFVISSSGVCSMVCILQKQQCVFRLLFFWYLWQSLPPHPGCLDLCLSASLAPGSGHLCAWQVWSKHSVTHLDNTSPWCLSGMNLAAHSLVSGTFQGLYITGKHQMGWIETILQKVLWDWLPQWSFQLEAE